MRLHLTDKTSLSQRLDTEPKGSPEVAVSQGTGVNLRQEVVSRWFPLVCFSFCTSCSTQDLNSPTRNGTLAYNGRHQGILFGGFVCLFQVILKDISICEFAKQRKGKRNGRQ